MTIRFQQPGHKIDWTNDGEEAVAANTIVVIGALIGVTTTSVAVGGTGVVALEGVFSGVPKTTGKAWAQGDVLDWDASTSKFEKGLTTATGDVTSAVFAFEAAASGDTTGTVRLVNPGVYQTS